MRSWRLRTADRGRSRLSARSCWSSTTCTGAKATAAGLPRARRRRGGGRAAADRGAGAAGAARRAARSGRRTASTPASVTVEPLGVADANALLRHLVGAGAASTARPRAHPRGRRRLPAVPRRGRGDARRRRRPGLGADASRSTSPSRPTIQSLLAARLDRLDADRARGRSRRRPSRARRSPSSTSRRWSAGAIEGVPAHLTALEVKELVERTGGDHVPLQPPADPRRRVRGRGQAAARGPPRAARQRVRGRRGTGGGARLPPRARGAAAARAGRAGGGDGDAGGPGDREPQDRGAPRGAAERARGRRRDCSNGRSCSRARTPQGARRC